MAYALFYHFECATDPVLVSPAKLANKQHPPLNPDQVLDLWFPGIGFWESGSGVRSRFLVEEALIK